MVYDEFHDVAMLIDDDHDVNDHDNDDHGDNDGNDDDDDNHDNDDIALTCLTFLKTVILRRVV